MHYIALTLGTRFISSNGNDPLADAYFKAQGGDVLLALHEGLYVVAAAVDTSDLDGLFKRTNAIDAPWTQNPGVTPMGPTKSMSVGDIAVDLETDTVFLCAPFGWEEITDESLKLIFTTKALVADANHLLAQKDAA